MMFGRVEAVAEVLANAGEIRMLHISVTLESGQTLRTVRDVIVQVIEPVGAGRPIDWHADQYAQETIANELALEGWEVIGGGEIPESADGELARSASYAVRRMADVE